MEYCLTCANLPFFGMGSLDKYLENKDLEIFIEI